VEGAILGGDIFQPIVKYRGYLACNQYSQSYSISGSSDADVCCQCAAISLHFKERASESMANKCDRYTHTHPFKGPFSGNTRESQYQKGKTNLDFTEARDSEWQWHQLGHMQVCTLLQTDNHTSTPPLMFLKGRVPFLPPNQQRQSTEGKKLEFPSVLT